MSRSVSAVSMARSEDGRCPPRVPPPTASQVAIAAGATHTVISPRWTSARSSAGQFPTWYFVLYFGCTLDFMSRSGTCCRHDSQEVDRGSPRARDPCTNATHQSESTPFRLTRIATQAEPEDLRRLCQIRIDELEGFIDGLFGDEEAIELPERAHEALKNLREINAMLHGIIELLGRQPAPPASADDVAGTLRNVRELSRIAEQELHAVVLVCTRARQHRMATSAVTKPTIH